MTFLKVLVMWRWHGTVHSNLFIIRAPGKRKMFPPGGEGDAEVRFMSKRKRARERERERDRQTTQGRWKESGTKEKRKREKQREEKEKEMNEERETFHARVCSWLRWDFKSKRTKEEWVINPFPTMVIFWGNFFLANKQLTVCSGLSCLSENGP